MLRYDDEHTRRELQRTGGANSAARVGLNAPTDDARSFPRRLPWRAPGCLSSVMDAVSCIASAVH